MRCVALSTSLLTSSRSQTDQTLENQNEAELNSLHGKIKALRHVRVGRRRGVASDAELLGVMSLLLTLHKH